MSGLSLERLTARPPVGAGPVRVTVPVDDAPPVTLAGLTVTELRLGRAAASADELARSDMSVRVLKSQERILSSFCAAVGGLGPLSYMRLLY